MNRIEQLTEAFRLEPHPEGGSFSEVYDCPITDAHQRSIAGSIYFLLDGADISHFHQIDCEEIWYYHEGCGLRITVLENGVRREIRLGMDAGQGQAPMAVMPAGCIFAAENLDAGSYTFVSCLTAPHFTYDGFRLVPFEEIRAAFPADAEALRRLCMAGLQR